MNTALAETTRVQSTLHTPAGPYDVTIYCPDRHLVYSGETPDRKGIGGGVTTRIRVARALVRRGHRVTVVCNCPGPVWHAGVRFLPLAQVRRITTDILLANSTAGTPDLRPALELEVNARLQLARVGGTPRPAGIHQVPFDYLYTPSNFIRRVARDEWGIAPERLVVAYNGVETSLLRQPPWRRSEGRDPRWLVYCGHPDKGLDAALGILRLLRRTDPRFELHIYGGDGLYGGTDKPVVAEAGVFYHGTIGQRALHRALQRGNIALHLQALREAFGMSLLEAMAAGCIALASPVGAYPEIVRHGYNGFLISGDHMSPDTWETAADLVRHLVQHPEFAEYVRRNARATPFTWDTIARAWEGHWKWALDRVGSQFERFQGWTESCRECGGALLTLADGYHCTRCGMYMRTL